MQHIRIIIKLTFHLCFTLLFAACLSPIDFETESIGGKLVVSGQVSTVADQTLVFLGRTSDEDRLPIPENKATVWLLDESGNQTYFAFTTEGRYMPENFLGVPGKTYFLRVEFLSGEVYESIPEQLPVAAGSIKPKYEIFADEFVDNEGTVSNQPGIKIFGDVVLPASQQDRFVTWSVDETFLLSPTDFPDPFGSIPPPCFIQQSADPQRVSIYDGSNLKAETLSDILLASRLIDYTFLEKHYFTVYQSVITPEAYEYWRKVNVLANQVGSIFDTPPARITGNIFSKKASNTKVFGYFQATNQVFERFSILPYELPFRLTMPDCVFKGFDVQYPTRCLDCLSVRNSSYKRPSWF